MTDKDKRREARIASAIDAQVAERGYEAPVDIFVELGILRPADLLA